MLSRAIRHSVERARGAHALLESERKSRSVIEQSVDGIVLIDEDGIIIEWNQAQEQISGMARAEVMGRPIWDVQFQLAPDEKKTPANYASLKAMLQAFLSSGQPAWPVEIPQQEIQRPDGERRIVQTSAYAIKTHKGFMASSIVRDVTIQVRAQRGARRGLFIFAVHPGRAVGPYRHSG